jgi:hypothetical protein
MSERDDKRGGLGCAIAGMVLILLPVLYVLGIGPANLIALNYPNTQPMWRVVYWPIGVVGEHSPQVQDWLTWYMNLWV